MPDEHYKPDPLLRKRTILQEVPVSEATLWEWVRRGSFPRPVVLNPGQKREIIAWRQSDYLAWRDSLPQRLANISAEPSAKRRQQRKQLVTRPKE